MTRGGSARYLPPPSRIIPPPTLKRRLFAGGAGGVRCGWLCVLFLIHIGSLSCLALSYRVSPYAIRLLSAAGGRVADERLQPEPRKMVRPPLCLPVQPDQPCLSSSAIPPSVQPDPDPSHVSSPATLSPADPLPAHPLPGPPPPPHPRADPAYIEAVMDELVERLQSGESLVAICDSDPRLPCYDVIADWRIADPVFDARIMRAREVGFIRRAERTVEEVRRAENAPLGRLIFDAERWYLGALSKAFADKEGPNGKEKAGDKTGDKGAGNQAGGGAFDLSHLTPAQLEALAALDLDPDDTDDPRSS